MTLSFNISDLTVAEVTKEYIQEKLTKLGHLLDSHKQVNVFIKNNKRGSRFPDISLEVTIKMPHGFIKVVEAGSNLNAICDKMIPVVASRLKRYQSRFADWHKQNHPKVKELDDQHQSSAEIETAEEYIDYQPRISRKSYDDDSPLHPAQAVEKMVLLGRKSFLFKNIESGKYGMIYSRKGGYTLVEPGS